MMTLEERLREKRSEILQIAERYGVSNVRVFGSVARRETRPDSDIDLLVDLEPRRTLLDFIGFKQSVESLLGCRVDLAETETLHEAIRDRVLREAIPL
jgi:predicted nucleotidyltransferase